MNKVLEISNIQKTFSDSYIGTSGKDETSHAHILKGINLTLNQATVTALIGGNGSGKSTLFNIISGLLPPTAGNILYYHHKKTYSLNQLPAHKHSRIGIARLFQGSNTFSNLTVLENMMVADDSHIGEQPWDILIRPQKIKQQEKHRKNRAFTILKDLLGEKNPLWIKRNDPAGSLSIGQQRLLAFARLFMNKKAQLFLLDEPCAGVNAQIRNTMITLIAQLKKEGKTVLLIEHNMDFAQKTATNAFYLEEGEIVLKGKINEVIANPLVQKNYLGNI